MIIGFTGTRNGMTMRQKQALTRWLRHYRPLEFHHGQCVGADHEAASIARQMAFPEPHRFGGPRITIVSHPPINDDLRSPFAENDLVMPERGYLERDRDIAEVCDVLLACPDGPRRANSGTWYTIDYAQKLLRAVHVILP